MNRLLDRSLDFIKLLPGVPRPRKHRAAASRRDSPLHRAADSHLAKVSVAVRYAFARGRKSLGRSEPNVDAAIAAVRKALGEVLPQTLLKVYVAGGEAAAGTLRTAAFDPDQPRDEHGQWTSGGVAPDLGESAFPSFDENNEHSPEWKTLIKHDAFLDNLSESDERDSEKMAGAIDEYVHSPDRLNDALRANPDLLDEEEEEDDENYDEEDRDIRRSPESLSSLGRELENAMADAPKIKEPVTVYRGLRGVTAEEIAKSPTVTLNGFQSTSFNPKIAASFMGEKSSGLVTGKNLSGVLLKITAKYGLAFGHAHSVDGEMEMLLPHGDTYKVLGVSKTRYLGRTFEVVHLKQGGE